MAFVRSSPIGEMTRQLCHFTDSIRISLGHGADVQLAVTLLLDVGYHSLEGGAATDGWECLGGNAIGDAL